MIKITWTTEKISEERKVMGDYGVTEVSANDFESALTDIETLLDEIDRLTAELAELNDKAVFIQFKNEDELPADISDNVYSAMFECSHVDGVRLFPYIEENGQKYFLVMLRKDE